MFKIIVLVVVSSFFYGCSSNIVNGVNSGDKAEVEKLIKESDKKLIKLNNKISDLEAKKIKYQSDLEMYNNNPVLDELDELLKSKTSSDDANNTQIKDN